MTENHLTPLLTALRASAEPTRLRLLALCAYGELTVSELVQILSQSQPRISRHLKLLSEAGLLERLQEGSWVFYRLTREGSGAAVAESLLKLLPDADDTLNRDLQRLADVKRDREEVAADYFSRNAAVWDGLRTLHVDDSEVEDKLLEIVPQSVSGALLDIGTGTARMMELFAPRFEKLEGVDLSHEMLAVARANLSRAGLSKCSVRQADMYQLPFGPRVFDAVTIHQVLHFLDRPGTAIDEAARTLKPGGWLLLTDFAPHEVESLRSEHAHRRLGFNDNEVAGWFSAAGLVHEKTEYLSGTPLTVAIWLAKKPDV